MVACTTPLWPETGSFIEYTYYVQLNMVEGFMRTTIHYGAHFTLFEDAGLAPTCQQDPDAARTGPLKIAVITVDFDLLAGRM
jgi:hypothetical protein